MSGFRGFGARPRLRGFALLGILVMNIQSFAMISAGYLNPTAYGDLTGANWWVWVFSHLLTDQQMYGLFSMLFGAGVLLTTARAEQNGEHAPACTPPACTMQTVIATTIFYGHGAGLFGSVSRVGQLGIVVAVWVQLVVSPLWLREFQYGPLEWVWRSLTYRRRMPLRRLQPAAA